MFNVDCKDYIEKSSEILLAQLITMNSGNRNIALTYSMGKDCLVAWHWLKSLGMTVFPVYFEPIRMDFTDKYIEAHEKFFGTTITRIPNMISIAEFHDFWGDETFSTKYKIRKDFKKLMVQDHMNRKKCIAYVDGFKAADSIRRRMKFSMGGPYDVEKMRFSPLWNLNNKGVYDYIKNHQIPVPDSYLWHKRSIELGDPNEYYQIKQRFPNDYKKITSLWPRVELFAKEDPKKPSLKNLDGCFMTGGFIFKYDDGKIKIPKKDRNTKLLTKNNDHG